MTLLVNLLVYKNDSPSPLASQRFKNVCKKVKIIFKLITQEYNDTFDTSQLFVFVCSVLFLFIGNPFYKAVYI